MPVRLTSVKYSSLRWEEVSNFKTLLREVVVKPFNKFLVSAALLVLPTLAMAQGKIAVVNLEEAILQTDLAQQRLAEFEKNEDFTSDKNEFESLREELDKLVQDFQRDQAAMSEDQMVAARQKVSSKNSDLEYVAKKLQTLQQQNAQRVFQELAPKAREVLRDIITTEQIGLLLQQQGVIHADLGYSITAKVTDKLNQLPAEE
ncbi:MAG: OmpH family outer membrane protein [Halieaceae bacterium]|jgi:outer membrane protein|nr:OmpH family outer membrane protein [Halieaceae bacterium]MBT6333509.1 OmpH family outer membrane protein [Halieaceae bacterium]